jgi:hypothetical protein
MEGKKICGYCGKQRPDDHTNNCPVKVLAIKLSEMFEKKENGN